VIISLDASGMATFWADGASTQRGQLDFAIPAGSYVANAFGAVSKGGSNHDGDIGLVRMYDRALKDSEVIRIYQGTFKDEDALLHDWQFQGSGLDGVLADSALKDRVNGQLVGGGMWRTKDLTVEALRQNYVTFDGVGDSITIPPLQVSPNVTFEIVYRHSSIKSWARLLDFRQSLPSEQPVWKRNGFALMRNSEASGNYLYYTTLKYDQAGTAQYGTLANSQFETVVGRYVRYRQSDCCPCYSLHVLWLSNNMLISLMLSLSLRR